MGVLFVQKGVDKNCPASPSFCFQHTANGSFLFSGAAQALKMGNKGSRQVTADSHAVVAAYFSPNVLFLLFTSGCCKRKRSGKKNIVGTISVRQVLLLTVLGKQSSESFRMENSPSSGIRRAALPLFTVDTDLGTGKYTPGSGLTSLKGMRWLLLEENSQQGGWDFTKQLQPKEKMFLDAISA